MLITAEMALLKKYIAHVLCIEGSTLLMEHFNDAFSEEEWRVLQELREEVHREEKQRHAGFPTC